MSTKSGFVATIGRPNSGKSSLLNHLVGEDISMVSHKANATRKRVSLIVLHDNAQIIFIDTPGLHKKERALNAFMMEEALKAVSDADLVLFLADINDTTKNYEEFLASNYTKTHILVLTKTDTNSKEEILERISEYQPFEEKYLSLVPISIKKNQGTKELLDEVVRHLPESPFFYEEDLLTTSQYKDIYKEMILEAIFEKTSDEIPYESDVVIEKVEEGETLEKIYAKIVVSKDSHKGVMVGKGGATIKRVGKAAREKIERLVGKKVFLGLDVIVRKNWTRDEKALKILGYN